MDKTLKRILSLIPTKPNGKFVHGAKKDFAASIGYSGGDIVSMWENETSVSYKNKLHEIAAVHNVSVEWLKGETDIKAPTPVSESGLSDKAIYLAEIYDQLSDELKDQVWNRILAAQALNTEIE